MSEEERAALYVAIDYVFYALMAIGFVIGVSKWLWAQLIGRLRGRRTSGGTDRSA